MVAAGGGDHGQVVGVDRRAPAGERDRGGRHRVDPSPQPGGQDPFELGQRPLRRLLDAGHGAARGGPQPDGHGDRLVVVEQERGERRPGVEAVAAGHARRRVHRVPEAAQPVDVAADRAHVDARAGSASSRPDQSRCTCSRDSRRSSRAEVSHMAPAFTESRARAVLIGP